MIDRICISINNRCNLACKYCHFNEKGVSEDVPMDVMKILENVKSYAKSAFKIGFVGNGEPFLDFDKLRTYIMFLSDSKDISVYTITNGTIQLNDDEWRFLEVHGVNVGFSIDGPKEIHNLYRGKSFESAMKNVERYREITGHYPTFNATVGRETIENSCAVISFFKQFGTRITFSRMIGKYGITLEEYHEFMNEAEKELFVRRGALDCTMYGGKCGAGANNFFFSNGRVYLCGNCINLSPLGSSDMAFEELEKIKLSFDRNYCYKESVCE